MTVSRFSALVVLPLLWTLASFRTTEGQAARTLKVPGGRDRPPFTLRVLKRGDEGVVEVSGPSGTPPQTLTCALVPYAMFVETFAIEDLDMDGHPDLRATREFGAKWERYCVWRYDPSLGDFQNDFLARQMELLTNLEVDAPHHRVVSSTIGPVWPSWDVYRIVKSAYPGQTLLLPEQSCTLDSDETGLTAAIVVRYAEGRARTQRHALLPGDQRTKQEICDGFGGAGR
jgi:hypothetical protein